VTIKAIDAPGSGVAPFAPATQSVDLKMDLKMFVVAQFDDGSLYPVMNMPWSVNFFAKIERSRGDDNPGARRGR
jgi:hypothetical protein